MTVYTTLDTLSAAWEILADLGIAGLLTGKEVTFEAESLLNGLLRERKLQEFLACITHSDAAACGALTSSEAVETIKVFFGSIAGDLKGLAGTTALTLQAQATGAAPSKKTKP